MTLSLVERPLQFEALRQRPTGSWPRLRQFGFLDRVGAVPLSDSEVLQTSLYLPMAVREGAAILEVVAVVHPAFLARSPVSAADRWNHLYMPIALRCLPFRQAGPPTNGVPRLESCIDLDGDEDEAADRPLGDDGRMRHDLAATIALLDRLEKGKARLASAAASLVAADLLVPLASTDPEKRLGADVKLLVIDAQRLRRLTPARTAALAADGFLPLDLATALAFSNRLWAPSLAPAPVADAGIQMADMDASLFSQPGKAALAIDLRIDDSSLFSFDTLAEGDRQSVDAGG